MVLVDRANYGRLKPVMRAIKLRPELDLIVSAAGSMVLRRFDRPVEIVRRDGFAVESEIYLELEGSLPSTMAKSIGFGVIEFSSEFQRLQPDLVLVIGDRYEALAAVIAAAYMNLCVVHIQGGEISGSIDESARHAMTKFSHFHYPSTEQAARNLIQMGERPETILGVGCPSGDIAGRIDRRPPIDAINRQGYGRCLDFTEPYLLVVYHPTTTQFGAAAEEMNEVLEALSQLQCQALLLWPNIDAGSDGVSKAIRVFRNKTEAGWLRSIINLAPEDYLRTLACAACAVGNSSSFVRDGSFFGTPVVLIGNRQEGRERDSHVVSVEPDTSEIKNAVLRQLEHGPYTPSQLYGDGEVAPKIAESLVKLTPYCQKQLYIEGHSHPIGK